MCDFTRKSVCYGDRRFPRNPVKLSRWELPLESTPYWEDVCHEIEKKYKKVRDPYPSLFSYSFPKSSSQFSSSPRIDDVKFKISPPTPRHLSEKSIFAVKDNKKSLSRKLLEKELKEFNLVDTTLKLPPVPEKREKANPENDVNVRKKLKKIYSKDYCPQHKNTSSVKIFDDEISKYLIKRISSVPKLPKVQKIKASLEKEEKLFRSSSASSLQSKSSKSESQQPKKMAKAPKLGMASLLPSFAKAISIDSCDTRESEESDDNTCEVRPRVETQSFLSKRDFLRVPNFSFVSSHPSFRNLASTDSYNESDESQEFPIISEGDFLQAEKYLKPDREGDSLVEDRIFNNEHQSVNVDQMKEVKGAKGNYEEKKITVEVLTAFERRYAYKALYRLRKHKQRLGDKMKPEISDKAASEDFESPSLCKDKVVKSSNVHEFDTLRERTFSRSASGISVDLKNKTITIATSGNNIVQRLPKAVVYQRRNIDRCLACLPKPLIQSAKVYRELPITTLKYVIENPTDFTAASSNSSSSSRTSVENANLDIAAANILIGEAHSTGISIQHEKESAQANDEIRVSFDERNLFPPSAACSENSSPAKSTSSKTPIMLDKSFSMQSSDRSKTSSPSLQSSDSDEPGMLDDKLPSSKSTAPCHTPVVWRKSLEPLRALRQKKFTSLRARAASVTAKSSYDSAASDSDQDLGASKKQDEDSRIAFGDSHSQSKKEKKKKPLLRMKTVAEQLNIFYCSREEKAKSKLKRSKTTFDLTPIPDDSESVESIEDVNSEEIKVEEKEEEESLAYFEPMLFHRAGSPPPPIMSSQELGEIIKQFLLENSNASDLFNQLANEFLKKLKERLKLYKNSDNKKYIELGIKLFESLLDSRRYLKPETFDPNLEFSLIQPPLSNSRQLRRILPPKNFELVAPILGMPLVSSKKRKPSKPRTRIEYSKVSSVSEVVSGSWIKWDKIVHATSSRKSDKHVGYYAAKNPYALFLRKPRRKAVVWRALREEDMKGYDPEATLEMRATRLMNKICKNFCDWLKQLGASEQVIDEETLKDMFEINFTAEACKAMQVILKEMPTVPGAVARARNCREAGELEATRLELKKDIKLESRFKRVHAFGRSLPNDLRFVPPSGRLSTKWVQCNNIPRDLESMDVVWHDILNKDIVSAFIEYLKKNPQAGPLQLEQNLEEKRNEYFKMLQAGDESNYIIVDEDNDNNVYLIPSETVSGI